MNNPKPNESDILASIHTLQAACSVLCHRLRESGASVPTAPIQTDDVLQDFNALELYHAQLAGALAKAPTYSPKPASAPAARAVAQAPVTELTAAEVASMSLSEKVQFGQSRLTIAAVRALVAQRGGAKEAKAKKPTITEKLLAAKGCKTIAEARELAAHNPNQALD
jgi:hypothetical protein